MKIQFPSRFLLKALIVSLVTCFLFTYSASARKIYMTKGSDNGLYLKGTNFSYAAGDTFVLKASLNPFTYFTLEEFHGAAGKPIVIINEGGQVRIERVELRHCTYMKLTGTGSSDQYGFYLSLPNQTTPSPAVAINGRSAFMEADHLDINTHGYGFWIKEEGSCDVTLQYPNWWLDNISIHDNRIRNLIQEGVYAGSTAPNGERPVICNGVSTNPLPIRLSNIKIYNNIIDHTGRGGIQLSGAQQGNNEVYGNTITNSGFEYVPSQGNGIIIGGYSTAYVHDNSVDYTYSTGIFSLGAGLVRIENNRVDHSGQLSGMTANGSASIMIDTRLTVPVINTQFYIKNNTLGSNTDGHIRVYNTYTTYSPSNLICNNLTTTGSPVTIYTNTGVLWGTCSGNQTPVAVPGQNQTVSTNTATLNGTGSYDTDGSIASYQWTEVFGPNNAIITNANSAQASLSGLIQGTYTFKLKVTDNGGASNTAEVNVVVSSSATNTNPTTTPASSTIHIEAENLTSQNGIQTENTQDAGGGLNVGWQDNNDWMDYSVNVASAGTYTVNFRVATPNAGGNFQLRNSAGTALATVTLPNTGGWQTWQTISASVTLPAGQQTLRIYTVNSGGGWNINWFDILSSGSSSTTTTGTYTSLPAKLEAENYSAMSGIQTENTADAGGGKNVGWQENGDWMDYPVNVSNAGTFSVDFRVATPNTGVQFQLRKQDGTVLYTVNVPNTGSYQTWQTATAVVNLPAGQQTLRVYTNNAAGGWNLNWMNFSSGTTTTTTPSTPTTTPTSIRIEAENYSAMSGIQTENTADAGGGKNVGWQENGDWMDYSVNLSSAGTYAVDFRVATVNTGVQFQLRNSSGSVLTTVTVPNTGWWQTYQTVSASVNLPAGQQTIRIYTTDAKGTGWNINWINLSTSSTTTTTTPATSTSSTIHVEAENFSSMNGIQTESTSDAGGGLNVGYQDNGDWMDYGVNMSSAGTYTMNFRVASYFGGGQFQVKNSAGNVLATVDIPKTGNYQTWQTVAANVNLTAGQQTVRIFTLNAGGGWNINWFDILGAGSASSTVKTAAKDTAVLSETPQAAVQLFPNPVKDRFALKVTNELKGQMKVTITNMTGQVVKQLTVQKPQTGTTQSYLSAGDLAKGQYIITLTMSNWTETTKMIKE